MHTAGCDSMPSDLRNWIEKELESVQQCVGMRRRQCSVEGQELNSIASNLQEA